MIKNYFKIAWRSLIKYPLFAFINISGLSVGIASCILIFIYVKNELSYDRFHTNAQNIFRVTTLQNNAGKIDAIATTPSPLAATLLNDIPYIKNVARIGKWHANFKKGTDIFEEENIYAVDPSFLSIFSFEMKIGNAGKALLAPNAIVLTEKTAKKYFGDNWNRNNIIGKTLSVKAGKNDYIFTIQGILNDPPKTSSLQFDFLLPFKFLEKFDNSENQWNYSSYYTYFQTNGNIQAQEINKILRKQVSKYVPNSGFLLQVQPLTDIYLHSNFSFNSELINVGNATYVRFLAFIGFLILLLACINFVNISTARATKRLKEIGLRKTVGASKPQLVVQFLLEASVVCAIALFFAMLLVELFFPAFKVLCGKEISLKYDSSYIISLLIFYLVTLLLSGFYPAFFLSSFQPSKIIKGIFSVDKTERVREAMLLVQFSISIIMIICVLVISTQLNYIAEKDLGFNKEQLLYVKLKHQILRKTICCLNKIYNKKPTLKR